MISFKSSLAGSLANSATSASAALPSSAGPPFHSLSRLADHLLLRDLARLVARDQVTTAEILAHIAEVDARKLYLRAAHSSMFRYCVSELHLSEDMAGKRIRAARTARQFPAIFTALAVGRLNLSSVLMLAAYLTAETADELLATAAHKTNEELELLLARRFPQPDLVTQVRAISTLPTNNLPAVRPVGTPEEELALERVAPNTSQQAVRPVGMTPAQPAPGHAAVAASRPRVGPLSPGRFALQVTLDQESHDLLRYAQALLGHAVPSGDIAEVLKRSLRSLVQDLEKQRFAAGSRSRPRRGGAPKGRHVPAEVRRSVWQRDGGQCTFVSEGGRRCAERRRLEFDHVDPYARSGLATLENMRLRCRAHNQHAAECTFGAGFMQRKREAARRVTAAKREAREAREREAARVNEVRAARETTQTREREVAVARALEVIPWLRQLGFRAEEARGAAALCEAIPDAPLEERVRHALKSLAPGSARRAGRVGAGSR